LFAEDLRGGHLFAISWLRHLCCSSCF